MANIGKVQDALKDVYNGANIAVLERARVIGCTTTGAAMHKDALA